MQNFLYTIPYFDGPLSDLRDFTIYTDGTCNYYVLSKNKNNEYQVSWTDEQVYFNSYWYKALEAVAKDPVNSEHFHPCLPFDHSYNSDHWRPESWKLRSEKVAIWFTHYMADAFVSVENSILEKHYSLGNFIGKFRPVGPTIESPPVWTAIESANSPDQAHVKYFPSMNESIGGRGFRAEDWWEPDMTFQGEEPSLDVSLMTAVVGTKNKIYSLNWSWGSQDLCWRFRNKPLGSVGNNVIIDNDAMLYVPGYSQDNELGYYYQPLLPFRPSYISFDEYDPRDAYPNPRDFSCDDRKDNLYFPHQDEWEFISSDELSDKGEPITNSNNEFFGLTEIKSYIIEAENCIKTRGNIKSLVDASGGQYVDFENTGSLKCKYITKAGFYDISITYKVPSGLRSMGVYVNNSRLGVISSSSLNWETFTFSGVYMPDGINYIEICDSEETAELDVDCIEVSGFTAQVPLPNKVPEIYFEQRPFHYPEEIILNITANDDDGNVTRLELKKDRKLLVSENSGSISWSFGVLPPGDHTYDIIAYDDEGATSTRSIVIDVIADEIDPDTAGSFEGYYKIEAEHCSKYRGDIKSHSEASNRKYVDFSGRGKLTCNVELEAGNYDLIFTIKVPGGTRSMGVFLNDVKIGVIGTNSEKWIVSSLRNIFLNEGSNVIEVRDTENTNELDIDKLDVLKK